MRKFLFLCLLTLWCVGGQAGIFKAGDRATALKSGTYFVYDACIVDGTSDWTGFLYSSDGAMKQNHGTKPTAFSTNDPCLFWTIEVQDESTGKCTMRNVDGLYVDCNGNLTSKKAYVWISAYKYGESYVCGSDVYVESADGTTSTQPTTTVDGVWIIGDENKTVHWASNSGNGFKTQPAGQPMALLPAKTTECDVTAVGELSAPATLTIGSYVALYNNATSCYVWEGAPLTSTSVENLKKSRSNQLLLKSTGCTTGKIIYNNAPIFKVGGKEGAYTFQNVMTGDYIKALNKSTSCYTSSSEADAETFSIQDNSGTIAIKGASNNLCFNQTSSSAVVGWDNLTGGNSQYKVSELTMTTNEVDVVEVLYNCVSGDDIYCASQDMISPSSDYTYTAPSSISIYGYTTSDATPTAEKVTASKTVEYNYTKDDTKTLPFTTSTLTDDGKFAEGTNWYKIQLRSAGNYAKYTSDTSIPTSADYSTNDFACMFMVSGDAINGFKIQNLAAGAAKYLTINGENGSCKFTTAGTTFDYSVSQDANGNSINLFKARGTSNSYLHDYSKTLGTWHHTNATTDIASSLVFCAVENLEGTVIFEGDGYEDTDVLVYDSKEYAKDATMPWYQCYNTTGVTVKDNKPALINSSIAKSGVVVTFPFKATTISNGKFADDTKWYNLNIRSSKYCVYDIYDKKDHNVVKSTADDLTYGSMYCFVKVDNVDNGYKMYNRMAGADVAFYNSGTNNEIGQYTTEGTTLILKANGTSGFVFQINGEDNAHVNDVQNQLGVWNAKGSASDGGSTFRFEAVSTSDIEAAAALPQPGKFYTIKEVSTSQYLTPVLSSVTDKTSRLAMNSSAAEADCIFYFTGTHLLGFTNGRFVGLNSNMFSQAAVGNVGTSVYFKKQSDGVYNVVYYYLTTGGDGQPVQNDRTLYGANTGYADGGSGSSLNSTGYQFNVTEVTDLPLTIGTNGWSTFSCPVAVAVPDGVTAYYAPSDPSNDKLVLSDLNTKTVPANTGIIVKGTEKNTVKFSTNTTEAEATVTDNKLVSNVVATSLTGASSDGKYAFATNTSTQASGFMKLLTTITLPGHKCWLQTNSSASSAQFVPIALADDPTGIESAETTAVGDSDAPIYDLQGRKVNGTKKGGMYIQNGKVFIAM